MKANKLHNTARHKLGGYGGGSGQQSVPNIQDFLKFRLMKIIFTRKYVENKENKANEQYLLAMLIKVD